VGIRSLSKEEFEFLDESEIETYFCRDLFNNENWINDFIKNLPSHIYVTIDLDVLDPSIMPAVGTPEPGGLGWYNITKVLKVLAQEKKILGFDIVELCPQPTNPAPDFLAAKLCYKLLGYIFYKL
jgi:agmatinase